MGAEQLTIPDHIISRLFVAGINYHKADIGTRGLFAVDAQRAGHILEEAGASGIKSAFVLSTCNRTEIYYCQGPGTDRILLGTAAELPINFAPSPTGKEDARRFSILLRCRRVWIHKSLATMKYWVSLNKRLPLAVSTK
jgi:hypothetical protein